MKKINYLTYWNQQVTVLRPDFSNDWKEKYFNETREFFEGVNSFVDVGCGSGDFIIENNHMFDKIIGIEFSEFMIENAQQIIKERNILNITMFKSNATDINLYIKERVDAIYSRGLIQYLTNDQLRIFIKNSISLLNENGFLMHMDIPNKAMRTFYLMNLHKTEESYSDFELSLKYFKTKFYIFRKSGIKHFDDSIGYWYSFSEIRKIAEEFGLKVDFYYSKLQPFSYRFHAKFYKN